MEHYKGLEEESVSTLRESELIPSRLVDTDVTETNVPFSPPDGEYIASLLIKYIPNSPVLKAKEWDKETAKAILKCMQENNITARAIAETLQVPQGRIWRWRDRLGNG